MRWLDNKGFLSHYYPIRFRSTIPLPNGILNVPVFLFFFPSPDPFSFPPGWLAHVNAAQTEAEVEALRECIRRRRPYGDSAWVQRAAEQLGLEASLRPRGRPRKKTQQPSLFVRIDDPE
jgi:hypothetical protein